MNLEHENLCCFRGENLNEKCSATKPDINISTEKIVLAWPMDNSRIRTARNTTAVKEWKLFVLFGIGVRLCPRNPDFLTAKI